MHLVVSLYANNYMVWQMAIGSKNLEVFNCPLATINRDIALRR